jgi:hypothetical protein
MENPTIRQMMRAFIIGQEESTNQRMLEALARVLSCPEHREVRVLHMSANAGKRILGPQ